MNPSRLSPEGQVAEIERRVEDLALDVYSANDMPSSEASIEDAIRTAREEVESDLKLKPEIKQKLLDRLSAKEGVIAVSGKKTEMGKILNEGKQTGGAKPKVIKQ